MILLGETSRFPTSGTSDGTITNNREQYVRSQSTHRENNVIILRELLKASD